MVADWLPHQVRKRPGWANACDAKWLYDELTGLRAVRRASSRDAEERPTFTEQDAISTLRAFHKLRPPNLDEGTSKTPYQFHEIAGNE